MDRPESVVEKVPHKIFLDIEIQTCHPENWKATEHGSDDDTNS